MEDKDSVHGLGFALMSETRFSTEDIKSARGLQDAQNQEGISYSAFFRLWPVAFLKHLKEHAGRYDTKEEQRDHYAVEIWRGLSFLTRLVAFEIAVIFPLWLLYRTGIDQAAEWVIAAFTIIMAVTTGLQWSAMKEELKRSDAAIEHMRLEQRAWVGVLASQCGEPTAGATKYFTLPVKNTGKTPARIIAIYAYQGLHDAKSGGHRTLNISLEQCVDATYSILEKRAQREPIQRAIPPETQGNWDFGSGDAFSQTDVDEITAGITRLYTYGGIIYMDVTDEVRRTTFCTYYDTKGKRNVSHDQYNTMD